MRNTIKKVISIFIMLVLLLSAPAANAATSVSVSTSTVNPGNTITIWGTTDAAQYVAVRITDSYGNIVYFGGARADGSGNYSTQYTIPSDMSAGDLLVTAGSGSDIANSNITIVIPAPTPSKVINPPTGESNSTTPVSLFISCIVSALFIIMFLVYVFRKKKINSHTK